jgi:enamine deaminase RidA (YjgF/YER057c/UK114 family)
MSLDRDENVVGRGDIRAPVEQVIANAVAALVASGATPQDVIRSVIYVVSDKSAVLAGWGQLLESQLGAAFTTASTLLGVATLGYQGPAR